MRSRRLSGGLHGTQEAVASRVLLLLDDGVGHGEAGHRLVALHAPSFCLCLHGTAAGTGGAPTDTGGVAPQTLVARYDAVATTPVPACSLTCRRGATRHSSLS